MDAVTVTRKVDAAKLDLPELLAFVGKEVERAQGPALFSRFQSHDAAVTGVVRAEVLSGVRDAAEQSQTRSVLNSFTPVDFPHGLWDRVGDHRCQLRRSGLAIPLNDVVLATLAIHLDIEVWPRDQHFTMVQRVLPALRLFREPTAP